MNLSSGETFSIADAASSPTPSMPAPPWMTSGVPFLKKGSGLYRRPRP